MNLKEKILSDLKVAMKTGDNFKRDTLRFLDSAIKDLEIKKNKRKSGLTNEEILEVIMRSIKQHRDSVEQYEKCGREDLANKERRELEILLLYMPEQLDENKIRKIVKEIIVQINASSKATIGKVMSQIMERFKGQVDGNQVKKIVEEELK